MIVVCRWIAAVGLAVLIAGSAGMFFTGRRGWVMTVGIGIGLVLGPGIYLLFAV